MPKGTAQSGSRNARSINGLIEIPRDVERVLCQTYGVRLDLSGAAATGAFDTATSDLDFVATFVDTRSPGYADCYLGFAEALEAPFGRSVDVIFEGMIRNSYFPKFQLLAGRRCLASALS